MVMILANNIAKVEIMIKGAELSSKLNSIGVVNDFGKKSEGKQDLTEIIDLAIPYIGTNKFLTFILSTAYVTSGESFNLYVALVDDDGAGISGKTITLTGSNGSVYSAITNNNGIATFIFSSISGDVTFIASYEDLTTTWDVGLVLFYDKGSSDSHKDNYTNTGFTRSFNGDYTTLTETTTGTSGTYKSVSFPQNCIITLKIKPDGVASNSIMRLFNGDTVLGNVSLANVGLTQDNQFHDYTIICSSDGRAVLSSPETQTTLTRSYSPFTGNMSFGFWSSGDTTTISFKEVIIKPILFYDKGSSDSHRDDYTNTGFTRSFNGDYTTLTETTTGTSGTYKSISFPQDCKITMKIKCDGDSSNSIMRLFNGDTVLGNVSLANVGLTQDNQFHDYTITCTSDGKAVLSSPETSTTLTRTYTPFTGNMSFGFWSSGDTTTISFKEVLIKPI